MIKKILIGLVVIIAVFMGYVALQPAEYTISREISINASADKIFPHVNNSKLMNDWNPWMKFDPTAKVTFSGPDAGVGTKTSWEGGEKLGTGSATVYESVTNSRVKTKLEYSEPFVMSQDAEISLTPAENQTIVRWSVSGKNNLIGRAMCIFMNMDKMVGGTFEEGLKNLKATLES